VQVGGSIPNNTKLYIMNHKLETLLKGESIITSEKGSSMVPLINSGQKHKLEPVSWDECNPRDIVYCKVKGRFYTHLVKGVNLDKGLLIGNNKGGINGWTKQVFGRVTEVFA
jgi:selenophosphate synthetase-related protein